MLIISGNIATGKSTLCRLLSQKLGLNAIEEDVEANEFIVNYYGNMSRWAIHSQIFFMTRRALEIRDALQQFNSSEIVLDRALGEDYYVFCQSLYDLRVITSKEYNLARLVFELCDLSVPKANMYIYLYDDSDSIFSRIKERGKKYEEALDLDFIDKLNVAYRYWRSMLNSERVIDIRTSEVDFRVPSNLDILIADIKRHT